MDTPIEEPKRISRRKGQADIKVGDVRHRKAKVVITRKEFHKILDKASQPIVSETENNEQKG